MWCVQNESLVACLAGLLCGSRCRLWLWTCRICRLLLSQTREVAAAVAVACGKWIEFVCSAGGCTVRLYRWSDRGTEATNLVKCAGRGNCCGCRASIPAGVAVREQRFESVSRQSLCQLQWVIPGLAKDYSLLPRSFFHPNFVACGVPNANRIVGGVQVRTNKYPWIAQIIRGAFLFCGGTLINDRYVLTAAHCVHEMDMTGVAVRLLQLDRSSTHVGIMRAVAFAHAHAGYDPVSLVHDIALLRLDQPVPLVQSMRPVCLPSSRTQQFDYQKAIVAGWGLSTEGGSTSSVLQETIVPIITNAQCRATSYKSMIVDTMLCAGYVQTGGKDACQVGVCISWKGSRTSIQSSRFSLTYRATVAARWSCPIASFVWLVLSPLATVVPSRMRRVCIPGWADTWTGLQRIRVMPAIVCSDRLFLLIINTQWCNRLTDKISSKWFSLIIDLYHRSQALRIALSSSL